MTCEATHILLMVGAKRQKKFQFNTSKYWWKRHLRHFPVILIFCFLFFQGCQSKLLKQARNIFENILIDLTAHHDYMTSEEHWTDWVTGFPIRKLILVALITFFGSPFAAFPNQETVPWQSNFAFPLATKYRTQMPKRGFDGTFSQKSWAIFRLKTWISWLYFNKKSTLKAKCRNENSVAEL